MFGHTGPRRGPSGGGDRRTKRRLTAVVLGVWAAALLVFRGSTVGSDAMGYSLLFLLLLLPATIAAVSFRIGRSGCWGGRQWLAVPVFGALYTLAEYATFGAANLLAVGGFRLPSADWMLKGAVLSAVGLGIGAGLRRLSARE